MIADGQPVPRGGGQYLVGKPYTVAGRTYYPSESRTTQVGYASWYGDAFHGRLTANGEIYDRDAFTAASPTMPIPSYARVTNLRNNYSMIVRVNDRGPYASNRIMDVSRRVAEALDYKRYGTTLLKVEYVGRASLAGSDDARLFATLRTDQPALPHGQRTMTAQAAPRTRLASNAAEETEPRISRRSWIKEPEITGRNVRTVYTDDDKPRRAERRAMIADEADGRDRRTATRRGYGDDHEPTRHRHIASYEGEDRESMHPTARARTQSTTYRVDRMAETRPDHWERNGRPAALAREAVLPPSRPMDLGTIPGAGSQIHAHREPSRLHLARSHDD